ncbi:pyruvate kinase [Aggregatibacter actinomycetemcomitans]|uniref:pyruvate kinase n=1 Tax=Aggregatibacter actinomycetemcomitans TaxID=714 RepID=UPI00197CA969|nr:pyruvate kinase [Aggregatibacter actinomycetemcomitans]MBN6075749.1 pyruvate kinase [Aggregatibacter actinomycetemcomitans]
MLNEQEKKAFLNGNYGMTQSGDKCKLVFVAETDRDNPYLVVSTRHGTWSSRWVGQDLSYVVSLWQEKPEPFNLDRALAGEAFVLQGGNKAFLLKKLKTFKCHDLLGYYESEPDLEIAAAWDYAGNFDGNRRDLDIVGMWLEPEPIKVPLRELPKPIHEIPDDADYLYYFGSNLNHKLLVKSVRVGEHDPSALLERRYYKSKEDVIQVIEMLTGKPYQD